jgi:kynurenine formamidase
MPTHDLLGRRIIDLGHPLMPGMPQSRKAPPYRHELAADHTGPRRPDGVSVATDLLTTGTHVGTHVDALCHVACGGLLHGGADAVASAGGGRFDTGGADEIPPLVRRGVLLDFTDGSSEHSVDPGLEVTAQRLAAAQERLHVEIVAGDVVLLRMGWARKILDTDAFLGVGTGLPGLVESGARWLARRGVVAVGSDTLALERVPADSGTASLPVHRVLLAEHGIWIIESLVLDELAATGCIDPIFVMSPLKLVGATASPVRPLALIPHEPS